MEGQGVDCNWSSVEVLEGFWFWVVERWDMRKSSLSCVFQSLACILARACSRAVIYLFSIGGNGSLVEDKILGTTEEEFSAGKYTEVPELVLALQKIPIMYLS